MLGSKFAINHARERHPLGGVATAVCDSGWSLPGGEFAFASAACCTKALARSAAALTAGGLERWYRVHHACFLHRYRFISLSLPSIPRNVRKSFLSWSIHLFIPTAITASWKVMLNDLTRTEHGCCAARSSPRIPAGSLCLVRTSPGYIHYAHHSFHPHAYPYTIHALRPARRNGWLAAVDWRVRQRQWGRSTQGTTAPLSPCYKK